MKHAGSKDNLLTGIGSGPLPSPSRSADPTAGKGQSRLSMIVCLGCALFLVAVVADAPVRSLAMSLDPTVITALRVATEFGNSAWSLGIGLALLALLAVTKRKGMETVAEDLKGLRSVLLLLVGSVAISGVTVSSGSASAATDASGNYTIANLAAGSYTLTPSASGYTFSPTSRAVTIGTANVTGQNFTGTAAAVTYSISGTVSASGGGGLWGTGGLARIGGSPVAQL